MLLMLLNFKRYPFLNTGNPLRLTPPVAAAVTAADAANAANAASAANAANAAIHSCHHHGRLCDMIPAVDDALKDAAKCIRGLREAAAATAATAAAGPRPDTELGAKLAERARALAVFVDKIPPALRGCVTS